VLRQAIVKDAAGIVISHNHPSHDPTPSKEDVDITRRLIEAAKVIGIRIIDHVVIGRPSDHTPGFVSLREKNLVAFE
jgi:DNA repair protein RadC